MTYSEMQDIFMKELRLYHYPVAVKFFYDPEKVALFKERVDEYHSPLKAMTFCQWELAARMKGQVVYSEVDGLGCGNAQYCFGWKDLDAGEIKGHAKYVKNLE